MKKTSTLSIVLIVFFVFYNTGYSLDKEDKNHINNFITAIKNNDKNKLTKFFRYPVYRPSPIPNIETSSELLQRFDEVFDSKFINIITNSDITSDWKSMGSHGIIFQSGLIWLNFSGKVITINYQSEFEKNKLNQLIKVQKNKSHSSLRTYENTELELITKKFRIRIDHMGSSNYRYAIWPVKKSFIDKPDLILNNGKWFSYGSGGDYYFEFKNGIYIYKCFIYAVGTENSPLGELKVYKNNKVILSQQLTKIISY